jgi:hypothetical protein
MKIRPPALAIPDVCASMSGMNKASLVMLHDEGIISDDLAPGSATLYVR